MIVSNAAEQRQQWLNGLQIGDEVAVDYGRINRTYMIGKINRITPTRRFTVDGKACTFGNDGREMGRNGHWDIPSRMHPVTDEIREAIARHNALYHIKNLRFETLTTQQLLDVLKVIKPS